METLRQVVLGTDFSACAVLAFELAIKLAPAGITLVHVCEPDPRDLTDRRLSQCSDALSEVVARHRSRGVEVTGLLRCGKPWEKLDNVAAEVGASLIVIGRHGAGRGARVEIGSVAEHLVRSASRPVLTVACDFDGLDSEAHETNRRFRKNPTP